MGRNQNSPVYYVGLLTVLVITFAVALASWNYLAPSFGLNTISVGQQQQTGNMVSVTKPLTVSLRDAQSGALLPGATITLYDQSLRVNEILNIGATGTAVTSIPYSSNTQLIIAKSASGYVTEYAQKTVPQMSKVDAESLSTILIAETMTKKPTISVSLTDRNGNVISNEGSFNMSGLTSAQFTVNIINTADNSGWKTSYDPINKVNLGLAAVAAPSEKIVLTGTGTLVNRGAVSHLVTSIPDSQITKTTIGTQTTGGSYSYSFVVNRGTLGSGQSATVIINIQGYFDQGYYASFGIGGPAVETLQTFSFTILG